MSQEYGKGIKELAFWMHFHFGDVTGLSSEVWRKD